MKRRIITTADGSKTIQIEAWNEQYHSVHGAVEEANHVYIKHGLLFCSEEVLPLSQNNLSVLEIGFGTGLNTLLTLLKSRELKRQLNYTGVEAYPVSVDELKQLNYADLLDSNSSRYFDAIHSSGWEQWSALTPSFALKKQHKLFQDIRDQNLYDLIYFDAFGARVQPELWTAQMFQHMYKALKSNGVLVTYSAKGSVRRAMGAVGFAIERLEGPPGKREMLRARKTH